MRWLLILVLAGTALAQQALPLGLSVGVHHYSCPLVNYDLHIV